MKYELFRLASDADVYGKNAGKDIICDRETGKEICGPIHDQTQTNLLVSAPDLLEALESILPVALAELKRIGHHGETQDEQHLEQIIESAEMAIAKAKGEK